MGVRGDEKCSHSRDRRGTVLVRPVRIECIPTQRQFAIDQIDKFIAESGDYLLEIRKEDKSVRGRMVGLANIWYGSIATHEGTTPSEAGAFCKYKWGLRLKEREDEVVGDMMRTLLAKYGYEQKLQIIESYPDYFPVLVSKGGLTTENLSIYLTAIKLHYACNGLVLRSNKEDEMLASYGIDGFV